MSILGLAFISVFLLSIVAACVWAWKNRAIPLSADLRRADDEPAVDPILRAESIVQRMGRR